MYRLFCLESCYCKKRPANIHLVGGGGGGGRVTHLEVWQLTVCQMTYLVPISGRNILWYLQEHFFFTKMSFKLHWEIHSEIFS